MAIDLCGWRVDAGTGLSLADLQPRSFRAVAFASGTANKIQIMGHSAGVARCAIYANNTANNRPSVPIAVTSSYATAAGVIAELNLSVPINIIEGVSYQIDLIQEGTTSRIRSGTIASTQRAQGAVVTSINDPFADPFSYVTGSTVTVGPYAMLIADSVGINGIDKLNTAQTSTATFNADFAATSFSISDGTTTKTAAATTVNSASASFVAPPWVDGETAVKIGSVTVTATDGTDTTTAFSDELEFWSAHPDDPTVVKFTAVTLTSVDPDNIGAEHNFNFDPPLKIGTQCVFDASRFLISDSGILTTVGLEDYQGQSLFWFLDPEDHIARDFTLDTTDGPGPSAEVGFTATGFAATGFTATEFIAKGFTAITSTSIGLTAITLLNELTEMSQYG